MFTKLSSITAGIGLYGAYEYRNYLILDNKKTELANKITNLYVDLSQKNLAFELRELVTEHAPEEYEGLFGIEDDFYYNGKKQVKVLKNQFVETVKNLSSEKEEYNLTNDELRKNLYAKAAYIFFINDNADLLKKIEKLPFCGMDKKGLAWDLGHWNTQLELDWVIRTTEQELPSDLYINNAAYLLKNVRVIAQEDLFKSLCFKESKDLFDRFSAHLNQKLINYEPFLFKVKNIQRHLKSVSPLILMKEIDDAFVDIKKLEDRLKSDKKQIARKAMNILEETKTLKSWEKTIIVSPSRGEEQTKKIKLGQAEMFAEKSLAMAHSTLLCVLLTQTSFALRKENSKS